MQPRIRTEHLYLLVFASLIDHADALPQAVQARPAVVVDRDQSYVSSTMKWVQKWLFPICLIICMSLYIIQTVDETNTTGLVIVVVGWLWMKKRKADKAKRLSDRKASGQSAIEMQETAQNRYMGAGFRQMFASLGLDTLTSNRTPVR